MLLSELSHPNQLHGLTVSQLEEIACQIRERHLQVVSTSGCLLYTSDAADDW